MNLPDNITATNHGTDQMDLRHLGKNVLELRPTEIHLKEDGALDGPSFVIVLQGGFLPVATIGQFSLTMMNEALASIGYEIRKKNLEYKISNSHNTTLIQ